MKTKPSAFAIIITALIAFSFLVGSETYGDPYRHTILIDGIFDFTSGEEFATTGPNFAFTTWDNTHLYLGYAGPGIGIGTGDPLSYLVIYLDSDNVLGGAPVGLTFFTQTPTMPAGFAPDYVVYQNTLVFEDPVMQRWDGQAWSDTPSSTTAQEGDEYVEMSINFDDLGDIPDGLRMVFCLVHVGGQVEWTSGGCPSDIFTPGYDPDFASYLSFNLLSGLPPNAHGGETEILITPLPEGFAAPWEVTGPDSYFASGVGDTSLVGVAAGDYTITWLPLPGYLEPAGEILYVPQGDIVEFIGTYSAVPTITSIADVPNDQGRQVRLTWSRIVFDAPGQVVTITDYEIFRRQDDPGDKLLGWDYLGSVPAHGEEGYQMVATTLCDSTMADGMCWSVFMLRAVSDDPFIFFDSPPDSGYSVDNLAPSAPTGLIVVDEVLSWDEPTDADFDYFSVYGSSTPELGPDAILIGYTTEQSMSVSDVSQVYLLVTATDFAGNEGPAAYAHYVSGLSGVPVSHVALHDNVPNPFNPQTTIAFELPKRETVTLRVFDMSGRLVRNLITAEPHTPGRHEVVWNGRDDSGRQVASGTYFYRLEAGSFCETKRMVLIK